MNTRDIRKLRRKFILVAMISFSAVMFFMGGLIYVGNLMVSRSQIRATLQEIVDNSGNLPDFGSSESSSAEVSETEEGAGNGTDRGGKTSAESEDVLDNQDTEYSLFDVFNSTFSGRGASELRYSTRFFAVLYDASGSVSEVKANHIAAVDESEAETLASYALTKKRDFGNFGDYYYMVSPLNGGGKIVVYLDCTQQVVTNLRIFYIALFLIFIGLVISFFLVNAISNRLIAPEIENARRQKQFITNASHELKTPVAVIRANTEIEEMMNGENEWTKSTMRQVDRLSGLISNLVMISRSAEQSDNAVIVNMDMSLAANETADTFMPVATQDGKGFEKHIGEHIRMNADDSQMRQLISLLLDNAIKYCDDGGTISIWLAKKGRVVTLVVSNSYAEGEKKDYSRFFDRFYREDPSHNTETGGYGIGLSIAESIVRRYRGTIAASWKAGMISFTCNLTDHI